LYEVVNIIWYIKR